MGKKGKKGKEKGGGKKKEPQITFKEAILAYKINIIEKKLEDVNYEIRGWEEKNKRGVDRNERLKSEQLVLVDHLLKQAKDVAGMEQGMESTGKVEVIATMKEQWKYRHELEKGLTSTKDEIAAVDAKIEALCLEKDDWIQYKIHGHSEHMKQIKLLEQELVDLQSSFEGMASHLQRDYDENKASIKDETDEALERQKDIASEKAMAQLDKYSRHEVLDNDWLKREVAGHREETGDLQKQVSELEQGNLEIMSNLFECKVEDLKISKNFFLTQISDNVDFEKKGLLEMDLEDLEVPSGFPRPKSSVLKAIEDKLFPLLAAGQTEIEEEEDTDEENDDEDHDSTDMDVLNEFFFMEDENDYLQLGPLELKLLNITGTQLTLHPPIEPTEEELRVKECCPDVWPVTQPMLHDAVIPR